MVENFSNTAAFLWSVADLLRGDFKQSQYGRVILPFTVLRRLECVLEPTRHKVQKAAKKHAKKPNAVVEKLLLREAGQQFYNTSSLTLATLSDTQARDDIASYVQSFSPGAHEIFDHFHFEDYLDQLDANNLLYKVAQRFAATDLSPKSINNFQMGLIFEELIRRFAESSNETAGEHFTPRDIVHLATSLLLTGQEHKLKPNAIVTIYDPTAGTGGFLSEADEYIQQISEKVSVSLQGQELNPESYAICKADMLIKGQSIDNIKLGNTLSDDQLAGQHFDFMLSNPPFGVDWKKVQKQVTDEHKLKGYSGRFGPGLPRVSDGSLLFLLHLVAKMRDKKEGGSRIGIILNASPLFTGGAGSGESEVRRYLLQKDLVEAIIALPTDMFYNTGIATYIWILSNNKPKKRQGFVQLINATCYYSKMRKSLGSKRQYIDEKQIEDVVRIYGNFKEKEESRLLPVETFGYRRITVERPMRRNYAVSKERIDRVTSSRKFQRLRTNIQKKHLQVFNSLDSNKLYTSRDQFEKDLKKAWLDIITPPIPYKEFVKELSEYDKNADICRNRGEPEPDPDLRDYENVPLGVSVQEYFEREVLPHVPDAWIDKSKRDEQDGKVGIVGFEIPFNRHFYKFVSPRPLEEIDTDLKTCTDLIKQMIDGLSA